MALRRANGPASADDAARELEVILGKVERQGLRSLSDGEVEDLGKLYRAVSTWLAQKRAFGASARRVEHLNRLAARAHAVVYGQPPAAPMGRRLLWQLCSCPVSVRRSWRYHALAAALLLCGTVYGYVGASLDPDWTLSFVFAGDERTPYATRDELLETVHRGRAGEVSSDENAAFAAFLWQHNTRVALMSFFLGFAAGLPTVLLLVFTGAQLGTYTYTFVRHGLGTDWAAWILPHGVTELLAFVLLAGGGLWLGHLVVAPGERSRRDALRAVRPDAVRLVMLAFPMLLLAAGLESFLRQSTLGDEPRFAVAAATAIGWAAFLGLVRPWRGLREQAATAPTVTRRAVPLPTDEELFGVG